MDGMLGDASSSQLLILIGVVLILAMLFMAVIVLSFVRRGKKIAVTTKSEASSGKTNSRTNIPTAQTNPNTELSFSNRLELQNLSKNEKSATEEPDFVPSSTERIDLASRLAVSSNQPASPSSTSRDEPYELLRFLHDQDTGQFIVEVGSQQYTKLTNVSDKKVGQYLLELAAHFLHFTNGLIVTETGMKNLGSPNVGALPKPIAMVARRSSRSVMPGSANPFNATDPDEVETALLESLRSNLQGGSQRPRSGLLNLGAATQPESAMPSLNLADQINEIVQARLRYALLSRRPEVIISSSLSGGIRIKVDSEYYNAPDEIPDLEVRQLIKDSIKEWERR